jgi:hypothetical protein
LTEIDPGDPDFDPDAAIKALTNNEVVDPNTGIVFKETFWFWGGRRNTLT